MDGVIPINSSHPLVGKWKSADEFSEVIVSISGSGDGFLVTVMDEADGEAAEVFDSRYDGDALSFVAHWPSNGRHIKYRFLLQSEGTIDVTYSYSGQEIWQRQKT